MAKVFDSGLLDFAANESQYVEVTHNLGKCPQVIQFLGELDGQVGFPTITGAQGVQVPGPYLTETTDPNKVRVYKPDAYTYAGKFRVCIFE